MIKVICAWCECHLRDVPDEKDVISHGICERCKAEQMRELYEDKKNKEKFYAEKQQ